MDDISAVSEKSTASEEAKKKLERAVKKLNKARNRLAEVENVPKDDNSEDDKPVDDESKEEIHPYSLISIVKVK